MFIVTGGAGFIGANIVAALNQLETKDVIVVDDLAAAEKFRNLADCEIADYLDKNDFLRMMQAGVAPKRIKAVFHQGACSDTTETDGAYMMRNNFEYSKEVLHYCQSRRVPLVYASSAAVYGAGKAFREEAKHEMPLNVYGYSKLVFDQYVRRVLPKQTAPIVGLRYFNVYGEREQHKQRMASVAFHHFEQYRKDGRVRLFEGCDGYAAGEQRRDFVSVEDVAAVNLYFLSQPKRSGIYNVGTGRSQTFNDVALAVMNALREHAGASRLSLAQAQSQRLIDYIPFPADLIGKYQSFTEADIGTLRKAGYRREFLTVEQGVGRYVQRLIEKDSV
jgi:ADP-L-glycero-D-manno-heptose 6-epimerase